MSDSTTATVDQRLKLPELVAYREAASRRRAAAFCDAPDYVIGQEVRPLTPRTFSMLVAVDSHFILGGRATEGDVRNYLWFHSPQWCHAGTPGWQRAKAMALRPLFRELASPWRRRMGLPLDLPRYQAALALAVADIRRIVEDAFADCPAGSSDGAAIATMEAQMIASFARELHWPAEYTRHQPLRQLFQLLRCIRAARGEEVNDRGEQEILAAHLRRRQAEIEQQATAVTQETTNHG
jgi:hypothetical protein